jgi:hypothetical protein
MTDYYPLIARAIAGLDPNAPGENRRALYERARAALIAQLRSVEPPLSESVITRERLSLEEAVRKVESEAAQRARDATRGGPARAGAGDVVRRANVRQPAETPQVGAQAPDAQSAGLQPGSPPSRQRSPAPSGNERPQLGQDERPQRGARADGSPPRLPPRPQPIGMAEPQLTATRERPGPGGPRRSADKGATQPPGARGFRDITADTDDLGRAGAQAGRAARKNANMPSPEIDRIESGMDDGGSDLDSPDSYDDEDAEHYAPLRPHIPPDREHEPTKRGAMFPFKSAIAVGMVLILVGAALLWGKSLVTSVSGLFKSSLPVAEGPKDTTAPAVKPKITDRVGQPSSDQVEPVAQRVVLYDEDPSDPKGKQYVGSVVWRTEPIKASGNQPADIAVHADIEVPDRNFKMTMSFRRNTDSSLPASHTAELTFILPQDFSAGGVANVPGILMKSNEQARGTPLAGLAVKVTDGFFLVGLSNVDADRSRNLQLLKERSWFDVPLVYTNQRRAIIAIEKGPPGERAFNEAFAAWGETESNN